MDPAALVGMVRAAFTRVDQVETTRVRVHPDDAALLAAQVRDLSPTQPPELIPDGSLERGSIVIETQRGSIDASVSTQLEEIERGLTDQLRRMR